MVSTDVKHRVYKYQNLHNVDVGHYTEKEEVSKDLIIIVMKEIFTAYQVA